MIPYSNHYIDLLIGSIDSKLEHKKPSYGYQAEYTLILLEPYTQLFSLRLKQLEINSVIPIEMNMSIF
ncbi:protein of unknown function [Candidatus Nitrosocaldus cavascurensis]|jgi:hypothetical protein|uniref:Uncharacterized protein n=2 Tax=Candidatus Nitrosocaldaceae TaxID=1968910 RepID=A0A2K5ASD0_9ARCH|nr:protein of unknown function [Candidatus Nitrosocaldus cavascurensis]